jgi:hypothetical protein
VSSQPYFSRQSQLLLVAGVAAAGTGAVLDGVAATDTDEDSTAVVDFTAPGITDSTVAGAGSLEDFSPGGSRQSFLSRFPTLGTADTDTVQATAAVQATGMAADILVKALGTAAETQVKATQNKQDPTRQRPWRVCWGQQCEL